MSIIYWGFLLHGHLYIGPFYCTDIYILAFSIARTLHIGKNPSHGQLHIGIILSHGQLYIGKISSHGQLHIGKISSHGQLYIGDIFRKIFDNWLLGQFLSSKLEYRKGQRPKVSLRVFTVVIGDNTGRG